jgi:hypothetical protein
LKYFTVFLYVCLTYTSASGGVSKISTSVYGKEGVFLAKIREILKNTGKINTEKYGEILLVLALFTIGTF